MKNGGQQGSLKNNTTGSCKINKIKRTKMCVVKTVEEIRRDKRKGEKSRKGGPERHAVEGYRVVHGDYANSGHAT